MSDADAAVPEPPVDDEWLTTEELAAWLKVPVATIHQWRYRRTGPRAVKIGRHLRFRRGDLETWLAGDTAPPAPAARAPRQRAPFTRVADPPNG